MVNGEAESSPDGRVELTFVCPKTGGTVVFGFHSTHLRGGRPTVICPHSADTMGKEGAALAIAAMGKDTPHMEAEAIFDAPNPNDASGIIVTCIEPGCGLCVVSTPRTPISTDEPDSDEKSGPASWFGSMY